MDARLRKASHSSGRLVALEEGLQGGSPDSKSWRGIRRGVSSDAANMALLVLLYALQGVPLGLSSGSIPFILKARASYTEIGMFSLAGYPYAMKLLWSPIVDTVFHPAIGCRKSWVIPIQLMLGLLMICSSSTAQFWLDTANVRAMTSLFFVIVLLAATQDIAVDGWALTLLSKQSLGHASTCQTVGMNIGYFLSFTIFLALSDSSFCNRYLRRVSRDQGVLTLTNYLVFWGWASVLVALLLLFKTEQGGSSPPPPPTDSMELPTSTPPMYSSHTGNYLLLSSSSYGDERFDEGDTDHAGGGPLSSIGVRQMYQRLWKVATLSHIRSLTTVLLLCKLGCITAEAAGVFKLMEKGVSRETIALIVLLEFPLELCFAVFAGRWASRGRPFSPWLAGYFLRLGTAATTTLLVAIFPMGATIRTAPAFYAAIIAVGLTTSFASTIMFVAQGTFFARISDSSMGGTYLTLLNTLSNLGSAWPKFFVFMLIDRLTLSRCIGQPAGSSNLACPANPSSPLNPCTAAGGTCAKYVDGFFPLSLGLVFLGVVIGLTFRKRLRLLESAKGDSWRA